MSDSIEFDLTVTDEAFAGVPVKIGNGTVNVANIDSVDFIKELNHLNIKTTGYASVYEYRAFAKSEGIKDEVIVKTSAVYAEQHEYNEDKIFVDLCLPSCDFKSTADNPVLIETLRAELLKPSNHIQLKYLKNFSQLKDNYIKKVDREAKEQLGK